MTRVVWNRWLRTLSAFGFAALLVATLLSLVDAPTPLLSQVVHFQFYLALGWAMWIPVFLFCNKRGPRSQIRRGTLLTALVALAWHSHTWAGPWNPTAAHPPPLPATTVKVMWANVQHLDSRIEQLVEVIEINQPDVIGLGEAVSCSALDQILAEYPHGLTDLATGLVLCSKLPFAETERILVPQSRPILAGELNWKGESIHIFAVHALWPTEPAHGETCIAVASLSFRHANSLFMGDWNTTPWAPSYRFLMEHSDLRDARQGAAAWPTWRMSKMPWLQLPIDHFFFAGSLRVGEFEVGPAFGSDHNPVFVEIGLE